MYDPDVTQRREALPDEIFGTTPLRDYIRQTCGELPSQTLEEYVRDIEHDEVPE